MLRKSFVSVFIRLRVRARHHGEMLQKNFASGGQVPWHGGPISKKIQTTKYKLQCPEEFACPPKNLSTKEK
jgi:hypothetical protein